MVPAISVVRISRFASPDQMLQLGDLTLKHTDFRRLLLGFVQQHRRKFVIADPFE
jgi:hypothetical protein